MIKRLIPETTVYIGNKSFEKEVAAMKTIIETDVVPWLGSFNNVSFIDSENNYYYYDIGSDTIIMFFHWFHSGSNARGASIGLCRKDFREIKTVTIFIEECLIAELSNKWMVPNFELHAITDNSNNLVTLFIDGTANLPASNCNYIFFDVDSFGEKYIGFREKDYNDARKIIYLNDKRSILHKYYAKKGTSDYPNSNRFSYSNEDYVIIEKAEIFNTINNQFVSLSTNMVRIINNFLNTDKSTNFTVIEINGVKYRKLEYDIWIKDDDN